MTSSSADIEKKLNALRPEVVTDAKKIRVIKLEDFEEYSVIRKKNDPIDLDALPSIDIQPIRKDPRRDRIPDDPIFTKEYFQKTASMLEEKGYFARGDDRSPDALEGKISPKCHSQNIEPHYDIEKHRQSSDCSGFVSLTDKMSVAHAFGQSYESGQSGYYVYIAEMKRGIWMIDPPYAWESEHSAIGSQPIVSYRKCFSSGPLHDQCSSIFIKKDLPFDLKKKLIDAQLLPSERLKNPISRASTDDHSIAPFIMKSVNYGYHKKNKWMMHQLKDFPGLKKVGFALSGIEHLMDYSVNLSGQKHFGKAAATTVIDLTWEKLIGKGPLLGVEVAGAIGDFGLKRLEPKIKSLEKKNDIASLAQLDVLRLFPK